MNLLTSRTRFVFDRVQYRPAAETPRSGQYFSSLTRISYQNLILLTPSVRAVSIRAVGGITFCCLVGSESLQLPASVIPTPFACGARSHTGNLHFQCLWCAASGSEHRTDSHSSQAARSTVLTCTVLTCALCSPQIDAQRAWSRRPRSIVFHESYHEFELIDAR